MPVSPSQPAIISYQRLITGLVMIVMTSIGMCGIEIICGLINDQLDHYNLFQFYFSFMTKDRAPTAILAGVILLIGFNLIALNTAIEPTSELGSWIYRLLGCVPLAGILMTIVINNTPNGSERQCCWGTPR